MSAYDLVEEVKKNANIPSDNALGIAIGKDRSTVSGWKRGLAKPDGETTLKLIALGKIDPNRALKLMQGGYAELTPMIMTAALGLAFLYPAHIVEGLYIMLNIGETKRQLYFRLRQYPP